MASVTTFYKVKAGVVTRLPRKLRRRGIDRLLDDGYVVSRVTVRPTSRGSKTKIKTWSPRARPVGVL